MYVYIVSYSVHPISQCSPLNRYTGTATIVTAAVNLNSETDDDPDDSIEGYSPSEQIQNVTVLKNQPSSLATKRKFFLGLVIVCVVALSWVGGTQTAKSSFNTGFNSPFFVMYFGTAWMMLVFPLTVPLFFLSRKGNWNLNGLNELWRYT